MHAIVKKLNFFLSMFCFCQSIQYCPNVCFSKRKEKVRLWNPLIGAGEKCKKEREINYKHVASKKVWLMVGKIVILVLHCGCFFSLDFFKNEIVRTFTHIGFVFPFVFCHLPMDSEKSLFSKMHLFEYNRKTFAGAFYFFFAPRPTTLLRVQCFMIFVAFAKLWSQLSRYYRKSVISPPPFCKFSFPWLQNSSL